MHNIHMSIIKTHKRYISRKSKFFLDLLMTLKKIDHYIQMRWSKELQIKTYTLISVILCNPFTNLNISSNNEGLVSEDPRSENQILSHTTIYISDYYHP